MSVSALENKKIGIYALVSTIRLHMGFIG